MWTPYKDAVALLPLPTVRAHVASSHSRAALFRRGPMGLQTTDWGYGWDSGGWPSVGGRSSRELVCGGCPSQPAKPCSMGTQSAPKRGFTAPQPGPPGSEWAPLRRSGLLVPIAACPQHQQSAGGDTLLRDLLRRRPPRPPAAARPPQPRARPERWVLFLSGILKPPSPARV